MATAKRTGQVPIYGSPGDADAARTLPNPRLVNGDPKAAVPLVLLVEEQRDGWLRVALPVRPNGSTGWVRAADVDVASNDYRIEVDLGGFRMRAVRGEEEIFAAPIAVATDDNPTPGGTYYTVEVVDTGEPNGAYGPYALGLSGFSEKLTTFNGGDGQLGIHGTNEPQKIGSKVSHGCIRLRNEDITRLVGLELPLGTPVVVNA